MLLTKDCLFIEIPRTGTDTVRECFDLEPSDLPRHITLSEYLKLRPEHSKKKRITIVRNPFDRVASLYEHTKAFHSVGTFDEFVEWFVSPQPNITRDNIRQTQFDMLSIGKLAVNYVGKFEELESELIHISIIYPIRQLNQIRVTNKYKYKPYQEYYNERTEKLISDFCKKDLDLFDYEY